jgi:hypothetical protein
MIPAGDHEPRVRNSGGDKLEGFHHEFETLVGSPFSEGEDSMRWIASAREIRKLRPPRKNSMGPHMDVISSILVAQYQPVCGHEHGYGVRQ